MTTHTTRRVKLKRVDALRPGDLILPGLGLFTREGARLVSQREMSDAWGREPYLVLGLPWLNDLPELNVSVVQGDDPETSSILHSPMDGWVVLAWTR